MGLFDKFKGSKKEETAQQETKWNALTTVAQLDEIVEASKTKKAVIFKHSTRCSISSSVLNKFEKQIGEEYDLYYLDLIAYRDVSNAIAEKFGIVHQSPQAVFFENGEVTQHDSHYAILELDF